MKNKKSNLTIWIMSALVLGVLIGVIISSISTTGQAKAIASNKTDFGGTSANTNIDNDKINQEFLAKYGDLLNQKMPEENTVPIEDFENIEIPEPVFTNVTQVNLNFPKDGNCVELDQNFFDQYDTDINFAAIHGCAELVENVVFDYTVILNNSLLFIGNNHQFTSNSLSGSSMYPRYDFILNNNAILRDITISAVQTSDHHGILLHNNSQATNCNVYRRFYAMVLTNNSRVDGGQMLTSVGSNGPLIRASFIYSFDDSTVENSIGKFVAWDNSILTNVVCGPTTFCIELYDYSKVKDSNISCNFNYTGRGIFIHNNAESRNCFVNSCKDGVYIFDNGIAQEITAINNINGFMAKDNANIKDSYANNNEIGFRLHNDATGVNLVAENNDSLGFYLHDYAALSSSYAIGNLNNGILSSGHSTINRCNVTDNGIGINTISAQNFTEIQNTVIYNNQIGAAIGGNSELQDSAISNNQIGIYLTNQGKSTNNVSSGNTDKGIYVNGSVSGNTAIIDFGKYCDNNQNMFVYLNGIVQGTIYTTPTTIPGMYTNTNAIIKDCSEYNPNQNEMID